MDSITYKRGRYDHNLITLSTIKPDNRITAWISPYGDFWPVPYANHSPFAEAMCARLNIVKLGSDYGWVGALERTNCLHISGGYFIEVQRLLSGQMNTLFDWISALDRAGSTAYNGEDNNLSAEHMIKRIRRIIDQFDK